MRIGSRGDEVRRVQERLRDLGYDPGPEDGIYGWLTLAAVRDFQRDLGLEPDGIVGRRVRDVLFDETLSAARRWTVAAELGPGSSSSMGLRTLARQADLVAAVAVPVRFDPERLADVAEEAAAAVARAQAAPAPPAAVWVALHNRSGDAPGQYPRGSLQLWLHSRRGLAAMEKALQQALEAGDGVCLDFGQLRWGDGGRFLALVRRAARRAAEAQKPLLVALPLPGTGSRWAQAASDIDFGAMAELAAYIVLTPPLLARGAKPRRPPSPPELARALRPVVRRVPPWRCLLAVPVGALSVPAAADGPAASIPHYRARALAHQARQRPQWDDAAARPGFVCRVDDQEAHVWLETEASFAAKLALARRFRLAGLYLVGAGQEDVRLWRALRREHVSHGRGIWFSGKRSRRDAEGGLR